MNKHISAVTRVVSATLDVYCNKTNVVKVFSRLLFIVEFSIICFHTRLFVANCCTYIFVSL